jgi:GrpB-like predicted nucleotidyltransferase (UPF0157 family)
MLIQPYTAQWIADFQAIEGVLQETLSSLRISTEHIGSTAVPDLDGKAIIDVDIVMHAPIEFEAIKTRLEAIGYYHNGNQGIEGREVFKRQKTDLQHPVLDFVRHHLYVCAHDSVELGRHLAFRDYLRTHAEARLTYQRLKHEIAEEAQHDQKRYAYLKEIKVQPFINLITPKA